MNWAWAQQLPPRVKLVLMSLADAADDHGVCWPSVPTLARKCGVTTRTVRRAIQHLIASGLLHREPRFRDDGSHSSNRYTLALEAGDKLSGAPATDVITPGTGRQDPGDTGVRPGTTSRSQRESPRPPRVQSILAAPVATVSPDVGNNDRGGDHYDDRLEYPQGLSKLEQAAARDKLRSLSTDLAQQLLDELAGRMKAGAIRIAPLAYLRGLVTRARAGHFTPEAALQVAEKRKRRRQTEAALRQAEVARAEAVKAVEPAAPNASDSPLVRRLTAIRSRSPRGCGPEE